MSGGRGRPVRVLPVVLLTLLIPGLGHMFAGFVVRGFIWFAGSMAISGVLVSRGVKLVGGDPPDPRLLAVLVVFVVIALVDVLVHLRAPNVPR